PGVARETYDVIYYRWLLEGLSGVDIIRNPYIGYPSYRGMVDDLEGLPLLRWIQGQRADEHEMIHVDR
ncbi:hypothetical protein KI387_015600, partial [Taxus chinensis]